MDIKAKLNNLLDSTFSTPYVSKAFTDRNPKHVTYALSPVDVKFNLTQQTNINNNPYESIITEANSFKHNDIYAERLEYVSKCKNTDDYMNTFSTLYSSPRNFETGFKFDKKTLNSPSTLRMKFNHNSYLPKTLDNILKGHNPIESLEEKLDKLNRLTKSRSKSNSKKNNISLDFVSKDIKKTKSPIRVVLNKPSVNLNSPKLNFDRRNIGIYTQRTRENLIKPGLFGRLAEINRNNYREKYSSSYIRNDKQSFLS